MCQLWTRIRGGIERGDGRQVSKSPWIYFGYLCITQGKLKSVRALIFRPYLRKGGGERKMFVGVSFHQIRETDF